MSVGTLAFKSMLGTLIAFAVWLGAGFVFSQLPTSFEGYSVYGSLGALVVVVAVWAYITRD
jgi:uncharacterized BrkB/YihY/UPF0761 family membrane protein